MRTIDRLVLELRGDGSRTPVADPNIRPMEIVWIFIAFSLFAIYLDATDVSPQVIAEQITLAKKERERCEKYAKDIAQLLTTGGTLEVPGSTRVSCTAKQLEAS